MHASSVSLNRWLVGLNFNAHTHTWLALEVVIDCVEAVIVLRSGCSEKWYNRKAETDVFSTEVLADNSILRTN